MDAGGCILNYTYITAGKNYSYMIPYVQNTSNFWGDLTNFNDILTKVNGPEGSALKETYLKYQGRKRPTEPLPGLGRHQSSHFILNSLIS